MARPENRTQLMRRLGAKQVNDMWSWCAVNEAERKVYLSIWTDNVRKENGKTTFVIQEPHWGLDDVTGASKAARKDQDAKLALIFDEGYEPYGYFIDPVDRNAHPRKIANTHTSYIMLLEIDRADDGSVIGSLVKRIEVR